MEAKQYEYNLKDTLAERNHAHKSKSTADSHVGHEIKSGESDAGHDMKDMKGMDHAEAMNDPSMAKAMEVDMKRRFWIALVLTLPILAYSPLAINIFGLNLPFPFDVNWLLFLLTTPVVFWAGSVFITGAYYSLKAKQLNMSVLVSTGVLAAYFFSVLITVMGLGETYFEAAAMLVTFVLFGHWMEMKSRRGTSDSLRALFDLVPPQATVLRDGVEMSIATADIILDDIVVLKPGDKVPVDGEVTDGSSSVDESLVTGESMPVTKSVGDSVIGGSVNDSGTLKVKATKIGADTVLSQIVKLVETAQNSKAPGQRIADKAAAYLVIIAVVSGLLAFFGWYVVAGSTIIFALTFAISAVVIACPDALGLATPTAVAVGTGIGARNNILIKDAMTLESTARINAIVLDKTGTLTEGKPSVTDVVQLEDISKQDILRYSAILEQASNPPIADAIIRYAKEKGVTIDDNTTDFESLAGLGLRGQYGEKEILVGTLRLMEERNIDISKARPAADTLFDEGKTISVLSVGGVAVGVLGIADKIRESAKDTVESMQATGIEVAMITGDNVRVAEAVAAEVGITRVFADVMPEDKSNYVKQLQDEGRFVAMVGDGINDAPALAQADIGIAIGAGTDVAIETANIVLMKSDPYDIMSAITLSKATTRKMKQNLFWAAIYNVLAIPVAAGGFYTSLGWSLRPEIAALLMSVSSIIVALNAVSLKMIEPKLVRVGSK
ncbi:copper-translocating P-type ATPase [bacterium]|nr:copper-translocating P-type ATPase [bacterium]